MDEALWYYSDQIRLRDYVQSLQVMWNAERNISRAALLPEPRIHRIFRKLSPNDSNMLRVQKLLGISYPVCDRMATPHRAGVAIRKKTLLHSVAESAAPQREQ